jgi:hypothetical protein
MPDTPSLTEAAPELARAWNLVYISGNWRKQTAVNSQVRRGVQLTEFKLVA